MDRITAMNAFVRVVEAGTFTKAADTLDVGGGGGDHYEGHRPGACRVLPVAWETCTNEAPRCACSGVRAIDACAVAHPAAGGAPRPTSMTPSNLFTFSAPSSSRTRASADCQRRSPSARFIRPELVIRTLRVRRSAPATNSCQPAGISGLSVRVTIEDSSAMALAKSPAGARETVCQDLRPHPELRHPPVRLPELGIVVAAHQTNQLTQLCVGAAKITDHRTFVK